MSTMDTTRSGLESVDFFRGLPPGDLEAIQNYLTSRNAPAGTVLFSEGDQGDCLYIVIDGSVRIYKTREGENIELAHCATGEIFGEMALIDPSPRVASAVCAEDAILFSLSREKFFEVIQGQPETAARILRVLASRIRETDNTHLIQLEQENSDLTIARDRLERLLEKLEHTNNNLEAALSYRDRVLAVAPYPGIVTNASNNVRLINTAALNLFGPSGARNLWTWVRPVDESICESVDVALRRNTTWKGEIEVFDSHDKRLICKLIVAPISNPGEGESARLWVFEDLTEMRFLESQQTQRDHLVTKGEMAGEIAHELNNYLAVLSGNSELLVMNLGHDVSDKVKKRLDNMQKSIERIKVFTDDLLNSRHPDTQRMTIDLNAFLQIQIAFLRPQKRIKKITIETHWDKDLPLIACDPSAIQQLFYNLILNAADAMSGQEAGGSAVSVSTKHDAQAKTIVMVVSDRGPGIPDHVLASMFKERVSAQPKGRGFGLLTVARIVRDHKGQVNARNLPDGGAEFTVTLPVQTPGV